jgi:RND family efflux transporter MFP subunit
MDDTNPKNADLTALRIDRGRRSGAPGRSRRWLHLLWILVPIAAYFAYQVALKKVAPAIKVKVAAIQLITGSEASAELVATGYVVAQVKAAVSSKATGRLRILNVEEGDSMHVGGVLAELENDDMKAALDMALATLRSARADSLEASLSLARQRKLFDGGHTTQEVIDAASAGYQRALAGVDAGIAGVRAAEVALENTVIRAPFNGTVLTKHADVGEMVAPFGSASSAKGAVVTMADMTSLEVEADVSESNINKVLIGQPCEILLDAYPQITYKGFVKKIVPTADRARATVLTKIAFSQIDSRVLPEMSARVNFLPPKTAAAEEIKPTKVVQKTALTTRENRQVLFIIDGEYVREIAVEIGRQLGDVTEILNGPEVGVKVVLSPPGGLKSGDKIEITN